MSKQLNSILPIHYNGIKMAYEKVKPKYTTLSISEDFMNEIKKHLSSHKNNYASIADFVREAVRSKIRSDTYISPKPWEDPFYKLKEKEQKEKQQKDEALLVAIEKLNGLYEVVIELQKEIKKGKNGGTNGARLL